VTERGTGRRVNDQGLPERNRPEVCSKEDETTGRRLTTRRKKNDFKKERKSAVRYRMLSQKTILESCPRRGGWHLLKHVKRGNTSLPVAPTLKGGGRLRDEKNPSLRAGGNKTRAYLKKAIVQCASHNREASEKNGGRRASLIGDASVLA